MKTGFNKKTNLPTLEFEESDRINIQEIRQMLEGTFICRKCSTENKNGAWATLKGYFASRRLAIEELGKAYSRTRAKREICSNIFSILEGFDMAVDMADKIILQDKMLMELQEAKNKLQEAARNESTGHDEQFDDE